MRKIIVAGLVGLALTGCANPIDRGIDRMVDRVAEHAKEPAERADLERMRQMHHQEMEQKRRER